MYLFTKENAYALVRTVATFVYAWAATSFPAVSDWVVSIGMDQGTFVLLVGGLLYQGIRLAAEKFGWLGYLLIFNTKPEYNTEG
jgi:hypothetical protein